MLRGRDRLREGRNMTGQWLTGALLVAAAPVAWVAWLRTHPFGPCPRCGGTGRNWLSSPKRWGVCRACGGTGRKRRWL